MRTACTIRNCGAGGPFGSYWLGRFSFCTAPRNGPGSFSPVRRKKPIVRLVAVRAPVPFVGAARRVEHDHAVIDVTVGDIQLVRGCIDDHARRRAEILRVVAPAALALMPDLHQELPLARELQNVRVLVAAGAQPDLVVIVHVNAVLELRPLVPRPGPPHDESSEPSASNSSTGGAAFQIDRVSFGCNVDGRCTIQT